MTGPPIEADTAHRPWPLPPDPWILFQSWRELLFAHWPLPREVLRPLVPPQLILEEFDGTAWVGQTPFLLTGLRPRLLPSLPGISTFPELNLRTYVRVGDRPGIFFFSLDAASRLAVLGARTLYRLPYFHAEMRIESRAGWIHYRSRRIDDGANAGTGAAPGTGAEFIARYRPDGPIFNAEPGSIEHFLTERYALYVVLRDGKILRGAIHHRPWPLQSAEAEIERDTIPTAHGITLPNRPPLLHFSARQDTLVWPPRLV
jgi:uncharacterized protein YqjF (DUF2071 family)